MSTTLDILDDSYSDMDHACMVYCAIEEGDYDAVMSYIIKYNEDLYMAENLISYALGYNKSELIQLLLEFGMDANKRYYDGSTLLHEAAQCGAERAIFPLIFAGAKLDSKDNRGWTPLHYATSMNFINTEVIGILLDFGANINSVDDEGFTPIYRSIELIGFGYPETGFGNFQFLLNRGANIHARLPDGGTLLHAAANALNYRDKRYKPAALSICKLLIESGLSICDIRNDGATVLNVCKSAAAVAALEKFSFESKFLRTPSTRSP